MHCKGGEEGSMTVNNWARRIQGRKNRRKKKKTKWGKANAAANASPTSPSPSLLPSLEQVGDLQSGRRAWRGGQNCGMRRDCFDSFLPDGRIP